MDKTKLKGHIRSVIISNMCYTYRHDYGLEKLDDDFFTSGITQDERMYIHKTMSQLYDNNVEKIIDHLIDVASNDKAFNDDEVLSKLK